MGWTPPTESQFDQHWYSPDQLFTPTGHPIEDQTEQRTLLERLRSGLLIAVARTASIGGKRKALARVPTGAWEALSPSDEEHFWETGQLIVQIGGITGYGDGETHRYFDVRFDPTFPAEEDDGSYAQLVTLTPEVSDADQYERWLPAPLALKRLEEHIGEGFARDEIFRRLCGGELLAMARMANWHSRSAIRVEDYSLLGAFLWMANKPPSAFDLLWKTGTRTFTRPDLPGGTPHPVECFGIRFDPKGLDGILADAGIESKPPPDDIDPEPPADCAPPDTSQKPALSEAHLQAWAKLFNEANPSASEATARRSVATTFPERHVTVVRLRRVLPERRRGRPLKNKGE